MDGTLYWTEEDEDGIDIGNDKVDDMPTDEVC